MLEMVKDVDKNETISNEINCVKVETDTSSITSENEMPRIKAELDCLNYANESINNLEIEFEESKREYLRTKYDFDNDLIQFENKLGTCVIKAYPFYELRIQLNDLKQDYQNAKNKFETTQELYVAAKRMKEYCEDCLEKYNEDTTIPMTSESNDKETLIKMLNLAIVKVADTEQAKHSSDLIQIEAQAKYEEKLKKLKESEKNLKSYIEKSKKYYESKAKQNKELKFLYSKCEGLKQCLKEAKETYQNALKNLEKISNGIHEQRNGQPLETITKTEHQPEPHVSDIGNSFETLSIKSDDKSNDLNHTNRTSNFQFSQKKYGASQMSDEEIEYLRLDEFLKAYENELKKLEISYQQ